MRSIRKKIKTDNHGVSAEKGIYANCESEELIGKTLIAIHKEDGEEKLHLLMVDSHIPAGAKLY